jgi:hypothetical protein
MGWPWIAETVMGLGRKNPNVYFDTGALRPSLHFGDVDFTAKEEIGGLQIGEDFRGRFLGDHVRRLLGL